MKRLTLYLILLYFERPVQAQTETFILSQEQYLDKVEAIWKAQMLGAMMGWPFEHKVSSVQWVDTLNSKFTRIPVDDDWYYEMVAIRAFEKYGTGLSVQQLGRQWLENSAGSWGSSEQARLLMQKGIMPPDCGNPRYNKLWFTIGPQFSSDVYGALSPGMPNLAAKLARTYGHINGYAEAVDGGVFVAAMVSLGFLEKNPANIVKKAAQLIDNSSPYKQCLNMVIKMADEGSSPANIFDAIERRWHIEYPATNNAVANGGIVATCVWFGKGDFLKTINLAFSAADFTDADCNAANAASVVAAIGGMKALPPQLVKQLGDSIIGYKMGGVMLTPAVNETVSSLSKRTIDIGEQILKQNGAKISGHFIRIPQNNPQILPPERFRLSDLTSFWNPAWKLERAGFGGAGGGMPGIRGITWLDGDVLATWPRDEVKGVVLSRTVALKDQKHLYFEAGVDSGRVWQCVVYAGNKKLYDKILEGNEGGRSWYPVTIDLSSFQKSTVILRLYQRVLIAGKTAGNAYWRNFQIE